MILKISQLAYYNPEIDQRIEKMKIIRCLEEYGKQWRPKQRKLGWQKQKEEKQKNKKGESNGSTESSKEVGDLG